ncbi:aldo/keto reductase [Glaciimonas sp. GG7]
MNNPLFLPTIDGLPLGFGGAPIGNLFTALSNAQASDLLTHVLAQGCRTFDTAPHYGKGLSERRIGDALRSVSPSHYVLSTKVGRLLKPATDAPREQHSYVDVLPFVQQYDYSFDGTLRSVEDSLQRLGLASFDVAYIHDMDVATHGTNAPTILQAVISGAIPALQRLKEQGLIKAFGLGVNDAQICIDVMQQAHLDCLMLAGRYSLLDQTGLTTLLPLCEQAGTRVALGGVFNSGILATGVRGLQPASFDYGPASAEVISRAGLIEDVCAEFAVPLRAAALQFPLAHKAVEIVMLGARNIGEWDDAGKMMRHVIPTAFWSALQARGLLPEHAPLPSKSFA